MAKADINVYIDESGSITKKDIEHHKYFVIAILFTRNSQRVKRYFKKGIASLTQNAKYRECLKSKGEIKGSEVTETKKLEIYDRIIRNCKDDFEIGIIVLDNNYTTDTFIKNHARTFNYILQVFFDVLFRNSSKYANTILNMHMVIDEQNIATDADYTLDGYLNQQLNIVNPICNHFDVTYVDSKYHPLVQLIDFVSNTFYRNLEKHDKTSVRNIRLLQDCLCGKRIFDFSTNHDTKVTFHTHARFRHNAEIEKNVIHHQQTESAELWIDYSPTAILSVFFSSLMSFCIPGSVFYLLFPPE